MTLLWESDDYRGRPKARCYPFDLDGHSFRGQNPQDFVHEDFVLPLHSGSHGPSPRHLQALTAYCGYLQHTQAHQSAD
jgi:hypothetical protein